MSPGEEFIERLLQALSAAKLEAVVVGSMAGALQGAPVLTQDIDFVIRDTELNRQKLEELARRLGSGRPMLISEMTRAVRLPGLPVGVDFLFDVIGGGLSFQHVRARSVRVPIGSAEAVVACLEDVIASKEAAGRPKDLAQLPILRDALRVKRALEEP